MPDVNNALKQYLESGFSCLEVDNLQSRAPLSGSDVDRAVSLLAKFNNAVFILDNQRNDESGIIIETARKFCSDASGRLQGEVFQLDAKQLETSAGEPAVILEELFGLLEKKKEKILLVIKFLEVLAKDERLVKLLQDIIKNSSVPLLGLTTIDGFRQLEQKVELAASLQFILSEKSLRMDKRDKKVLIIGATSLFGNAVYDLFSREYKSVKGTGFSKAESLGFDKLDVTSEEEIKRYFLENSNFDIVIYIAGEADADEAEKARDRARRLNVDAVPAIARYAKNCKFVYISSEYVFDGSTGPYGSYSQAKPINYYGRTKLEGEKASLKDFSNALVVRLGALYGYNGPNDKKTSVSKIIASLDKPEALEADNFQVKHPIPLEDAARTLLKLLDYGVSGIYQTNGSEGLNKREMAEQIAAVRSEVTGRIFSYPVIGVKQTGVAAKPLDTHMVNVDTPRLFNEGVRSLFLKQGVFGEKKNNENQ